MFTIKTNPEHSDFHLYENMNIFFTWITYRFYSLNHAIYTKYYVKSRKSRNLAPYRLENCEASRATKERTGRQGENISKRLWKGKELGTNHIAAFISPDQNFRNASEMHPKCIQNFPNFSKMHLKCIRNAFLLKTIQMNQKTAFFFKIRLSYLLNSRNIKY